MLLTWLWDLQLNGCSHFWTVATLLAEAEAGSCRLEDKRPGEEDKQAEAGRNASASRPRLRCQPASLPPTHAQSHMSVSQLSAVFSLLSRVSG